MRSILILSLVVALVAPALANAAVISWQGPTAVDASGDSQVRADGETLVAENYAGGSLSLNGITFTGESTGTQTTLLSGVGGAVSVFYSGANATMSPLLNPGFFDNNNGAPGYTVELSGLTMGNTYIVQLFGGDDRAFFPNAIEVGDGTGDFGFKWGFPVLQDRGSFILGTFVADGGTQSFGVRRDVVAQPGGGGAILAGINVREAYPRYAQVGTGLVPIDCAQVVAGCASVGEPHFYRGSDLTTDSSHPNADLRGANLTGADLTFSDYSNANLSDANLTNVDALSSNLDGADFTRASLIGFRGQIVGTPATLPASYLLANQYIVGPGVDLSTADLSGVDLTGVDLTGANVSGADLTGADLTGAILTGVGGQLSGLPSALPAGYLTANGYLVGPDVDLTGADLVGANLTGADLSGANLTAADLSGAILTGVSGQPAGLPAVLPAGYATLNGYIVGPGVDLAGVDLAAADLSGLDLTGANLTDANLANAVLTGVDLSGADLTGADLTGVDLSGVVALAGVRGQLAFVPIGLPALYTTVDDYIVGPGVDLAGADFSGADLSGLDLSGADLGGADLTGATLVGANLTGASFDSRFIASVFVTTLLSGSDLSGTTLTGVRGRFAGTPTLPAGYVLIAESGGLNVIAGPAVDLSSQELAFADLSGLDLTGANLSGMDLTGVDLTNTLLQSADLSGADLADADLTGVDLSQAILTGVRGAISVGPSALPPGFFVVNDYIVGPSVNLSSAALAGADLSGLDLSGTNMIGADLTGVNLAGTHLSGANLSGTTLTGVRGQLASPPAVLRSFYSIVNDYIVGPGVDLSTADLMGEQFFEDNLTGADLSGADLRSAYLIQSDWRGVDLSGALMTGAVVANMDLRDADLSGADLTDAFFLGGIGIDLRGANLAGAQFSGVDLTFATLAGVRGQLASLPAIMPGGYSIANDYIVGPGVDLSNADLAGADLTGVNLAGADLTSASYDELTLFPSGSDYTVAPWGLAAGISPWAAGMIPVPEPSLSYLLAGGMASLIAMSRTRRRR